MLEEYKENISIFTKEVEAKKSIIQQLEQVNQVNESLTQDEQKTLEKRLFNLKQKLENEREKLKSIDKILSAKTTPSGDESQNDSASKISAFEDSSFDRNCNLMSKSFNENMFFNRNKIEVSHFDFNLLNGESKEEDKVLNNVVVVAPDSRNSTIRKLSRNKSTDTESSSNASPLMMPKYHSLSSSNLPQEGLVPYTKNVTKSNGAGQSTGVVQRQIPKHKRPLTRYLPNFSLDFNLKRHIETAGHQIQLCPHVTIDGKHSFLNYIVVCLADIHLLFSL